MTAQIKRVYLSLRRARLKSRSTRGKEVIFFTEMFKAMGGIKSEQIVLLYRFYFPLKISILKIGVLLTSFSFFC